MKTSQQQLLEAASRAGATALTGPRAAAAVSPAAAEGWLNSLAEGVRGSELGGAPAKTRAVSSPEQSSTGLLAAAHAVAAYWQAAGRLIDAAQTAAPETSSSSPPIIRVTHVTPEGGLAAVELSHADLGALSLEISLSGRTLSVLASAETEHAAAAIREGQAALAARLESQGIVLQTLEVVVLRRRVPGAAKKNRKES
ncbi:MAG TPA: flagellar hook-length control protein FliK [Polyangiales bacterium]|nr:flagellar hook-length control protein FliK [Polyangiales bacterium]